MFLINTAILKDYYFYLLDVIGGGVAGLDKITRLYASCECLSSLPQSEQNETYSPPTPNDESVC